MNLLGCVMVMLKYYVVEIKVLKLYIYICVCVCLCVCVCVCVKMQSRRRLRGVSGTDAVMYTSRREDEPGT